MGSTEHRIKRRVYNFEFATDDLTLDENIVNIYGEVVKILVIIPNWTNTVSLNVRMTNGGGREIFKSSDLDQDEEYDITLCRNECICVENECKWNITLSGVPGGTGGTVQLIAYIGG